MQPPRLFVKYPGTLWNLLKLMEPLGACVEPFGALFEFRSIAQGGFAEPPGVFLEVFKKSYCMQDIGAKFRKAPEN